MNSRWICLSIYIGALVGFTGCADVVASPDGSGGSGGAAGTGGGAAGAGGLGGGGDGGAGGVAASFCGDGVVDDGEECDDGNALWGDSCFECSARYYFILNSPSTSSEGDDSITRVDKRGHSEIILGPDVEYSGMREIELEPDGSVLYALQSHFTLMQHRIIYIDPSTGSPMDAVALDEAALGYSASPATMTRGVNGLLYVVIHDNTNTQLRMVTVNPSTKAVAELMTMASSSTADMTRNDSGAFFLSTGSEIKRILPAFTSVATFADTADGFTSASGLTFEAATETLWIADSTTLAKIHRFDSSGNGTEYGTLDGLSQPQVRGLLIDIDGTPLIPLGTQDKVVKMDSSGVVSDVWTEDIDWPVDLKMLDLSAP